MRGTSVLAEKSFLYFERKTRARRLAEIKRRGILCVVEVKEKKEVRLFAPVATTPVGARRSRSTAIFSLAGPRKKVSVATRSKVIPPRVKNTASRPGAASRQVFGSLFAPQLERICVAETHKNKRRTHGNELRRVALLDREHSSEGRLLVALLRRGTFRRRRGSFQRLTLHDRLCLDGGLGATLRSRRHAWR